MVTRPDVATSLIGGHLSHGPCKPEAVHRSRHLDVGEDDVDIGSGFEDGDRLVGVAGFDDIVARIGDHFRPADPEQRLVFHDENDWPPGC